MDRLGDSILVLGDGNLSFSLALSKLYPEKKIFATVLEEKQTWMEKYGEDGEKILNELQQQKFPKTKVIFEVDATKLHEEPVEIHFFTDIIFNFPHHGGKTNNKKSRKFLQEVFESVATNMMSRERNNRFHITLASKQSGLDEADVNECRNFKTEPPKHEKDSWRPLELAAEFGLNVLCVKRFEPDKFPEYKGSGYLNTNKEFNTAGDAHTITFKWIGFMTAAKMRIQTAKFLEMSGQRLRIAPYAEIPAPIFHQFRPCYSFHISILFAKEHSTDDDDYMANLELHLFKLMHELAGPFLVKVYELPKKRCIAPPRREHNRIYNMQYQGCAVPLCKELANMLHKDLCEQLKSRFDEMHCGLGVSTI